MRTRVLAISALLWLGACANSRPAPIAYDADTCTRCHMQISDRRFSAEVVTRHGRTLKFDSIDCLRAYTTQPGATIEPASTWVASFVDPGVMLRADRAYFVDLGASRGPMGTTHGWAAVASPAEAARLGADTTKLLRWADLS
jgi:copper chaperone NosL